MKRFVVFCTLLCFVTAGSLAIGGAFEPVSAEASFMLASNHKHHSKKKRTHRKRVRKRVRRKPQRTHKKRHRKVIRKSSHKVAHKVRRKVKPKTYRRVKHTTQRKIRRATRHRVKHTTHRKVRRVVHHKVRPKNPHRVRKKTSRRVRKKPGPVHRHAKARQRKIKRHAAVHYSARTKTTSRFLKKKAHRHHRKLERRRARKPHKRHAVIVRKRPRKHISPHRARIIRKRVRMARRHTVVDRHIVDRTVREIRHKYPKHYHYITRRPSHRTRFVHYYRHYGPGYFRRYSSLYGMRFGPYYADEIYTVLYRTNHVHYSNARNARNLSIQRRILNAGIITAGLMSYIRSSSNPAVADSALWVYENIYVMDRYGNEVALGTFCSDSIKREAPYLKDTTITDEPLAQMTYFFAFHRYPRDYVERNLRIVVDPETGRYITLNQALAKYRGISYYRNEIMKQKRAFRLLAEVDSSHRSRLKAYETITGVNEILY